ncbi:MAG: hypothetical protein AB7T31_00240 [Gemmatimonadales bacterium]
MRRFDRINGVGMLAGAAAFTLHVVFRSLMTAGAEPVALAREPSWVAVNGLGVVGAVLVLLTLPGTYAVAPARSRTVGVAAVLLISAAWTYFSLFLSLYGMLIMPWLAERAPSLLAAAAPLPMGIVIGSVVALVAWFSGSVLLAIPFLRGRREPRWAGYLLLTSALWIVVGNVVIAPGGPSSNLAANLLSNLAPVFLVISLGYLACLPRRQRMGTASGA